MRLSRRGRRALVALGLIAAWGAVPLLAAVRRTESWDTFIEWVTVALGAFGQLGRVALVSVEIRGVEMYLFALLGATLAAPLGLVTRRYARSRLRSTGRDLLAPLRARLATPSWRLRALCAAPGALGVALVVNDPLAMGWPAAWTAIAFAAALPGGLAMMPLVRRYLAMVAAPLLDAGERVDVSASEDELFFSAVAVTREARALVGVFGLATLGVAAALVTMSPTALVAHGAGGLLAYVAVAVAAAVGYGRASRIAVGVDGVLVTGTSRTRFLAYRELEGAEATAWGDIVLRGRDEVRLQLHGDDAPRLQAILARIREGIERARALAGDGVQRFAEGATAEGLAQGARGRADYRARGTMREDLWTLVESPATAAPVRIAAAGALAHGAESGDRGRLRVAAARCAEPEVRASLERLVMEDLEEEAVPARRLQAPR